MIFRVKKIFDILVQQKQVEQKNNFGYILRKIYPSDS